MLILTPSETVVKKQFLSSACPGAGPRFEETNFIIKLTQLVCSIFYRKVRTPTTHEA